MAWSGYITSEILVTWTVQSNVFRIFPSWGSSFLDGSFIDEINRENKLGFNGKVAMCYANLLRNLYETEDQAHAPWDFKKSFGQINKVFSNKL